MAEEQNIAKRMMNRMRSMALSAILALGGLGLWGSSATAQYVVGRPTYAPGYYYAPGPGYYDSGYYYAARPAAGPYYYVAPPPSAQYYVAPPSDRSVPSHNVGLEPESLPAQIAEDIAPAPAPPRQGPASRASWWRGRTWRRTSRNW